MLNSDTTSRLFSAAIFLVAALAGSSAVSQTITAQEKLEATRQALLELAVSSNMKVSNAAYIDSMGVLHESATFRSDSEIRGIRVKEYIEESGALKASLQADVTPLAMCNPDEMPFKKTALINYGNGSSDRESGFRVGDHYASEISEVIFSELSSQLESSGKWASKLQKALPTSYSSLLTSDGAGNARYSFDIRLQPQREKNSHRSKDAGILGKAQNIGSKMTNALRQSIPEVFVTKPWPTQYMSFNISVFDSVKNEQFVSTEYRLQYRAVDRGYSKSALPTHLKNSVQRSVAHFIDNLEQEIDCSDNRIAFENPGVSPDVASLSVGFSAGLDIGAQFIVTRSGVLLSDALSPAKLDSMVLAEVIDISRYSSTIKRIAGPSFPRSGDRRVASYFSGQ